MKTFVAWVKQGWLWLVLLLVVVTGVLARLLRARPVPTPIVDDVRRDTEKKTEEKILDAEQKKDAEILDASADRKQAIDQQLQDQQKTTTDIADDPKKVTDFLLNAGKHARGE